MSTRLRMSTRDYVLMLLCVSATIAFTTRSNAQDVVLPRLPSGHTLSSPESITPADVFDRTMQIRAELGLVRLFMGHPSADLSRLRVRGAQARVVMRQARFLFERANLLSFEVTRTSSEPLSTNSRYEQPAADILWVLERALLRVLTVKRSLGITEDAPVEGTRDEVDSSDIFHAVAQAVVEVNQLTQRMTGPSDVFHIVTSAVHEVAAIQASIPGARLPDEPELIPNQTPTDVYHRLLESHALLQQVAARRSVDIVDIVQDAEEREVTPLDVSELASVLAAETQHLRANWRGALVPHRAYYPGRRYPSHVYQRAGFYLEILRDLLARTTRQGD